MGDIVSELRTPKSPEQLQANLTTVTGQIQTARLNGAKPDSKKVDALSGALSQVVHSNPELPGAWQAAVQLVNFKYQPLIENTSSLPNCLEYIQDSDKSIWDGPPAALDSSQPGWHPVTRFGDDGPLIHLHYAIIFKVSNCHLDLDDQGTFPLTKMGHMLAEAKAHHQSTELISLILTDAHVTYSGGKILPINTIQFRNCSFELKPPAVLPNKYGQSIAEQLLTTKTSDGKIQLQAGM